MMKTLSLTTALVLASFGSAWAEKLPLGQLSKYLNGLKSVQAQFTQINADGTLSTGKIFIKRPGRIRFEYDPPNEALVMAASGALAIFDPQGDPEPESYPLSKTPLSLILERNINLNQARMVVGHSYDGTATTLTVQDPQHPERGRMDLIFTGPDVELRQWVVHNENGEPTTVILNDMKRGANLGDNMFSIALEVGRRRGD